MSYLADCPACSRTVSGGEVCECGYLYVDADGKAHTARGEGWENAPNIPIQVVTEIESLREEMPEDEPPPIRSLKGK